jgi:hypothetical protein
MQLAFTITLCNTDCQRGTTHSNRNKPKATASADYRHKNRGRKVQSTGLEASFRHL